MKNKKCINCVHLSEVQGANGPYYEPTIFLCNLDVFDIIEDENDIKKTNNCIKYEKSKN